MLIGLGGLAFTPFFSSSFFVIIIPVPLMKKVVKTISIRIEVKAIDTELISASYPRVLAEWGTNVTILANFINLICS